MISKSAPAFTNAGAFSKLMPPSTAMMGGRAYGSAHLPDLGNAVDRIRVQGLSPESWENTHDHQKVQFRKKPKSFFNGLIGVKAKAGFCAAGANSATMFPLHYPRYLCTQ